MYLTSIERGLLASSNQVNLPEHTNKAIAAATRITVLIGVNEQAAVCFRLIGGKVDYASFFGDDKAFHGWARDLFLHYWQMAE